jgi:hypothetical protein
MSSEGVSAASECSKSSLVTVPSTNMASPDLFGSAELEFRLVPHIYHFMTFSHFIVKSVFPRIFVDSLRLNSRLRGPIPSLVAVMLYIERLGQPP